MMIMIISFYLTASIPSSSSRKRNGQIGEQIGNTKRSHETFAFPSRESLVWKIPGGRMIRTPMMMMMIFRRSLQKR